MTTRLPQMSLAVVGMRFPNRDKAKSNRQFEMLLCKPGDPVELRPEPKNPKDERAVAVFSERGIQLGYLTAERCGRIGGMIRAGREVRAVFQAATEFGPWIRAAFDGEEPIVPMDAAAHALDGSTEAEAGEGFFAEADDFYPDEDFGWPDE